MEEILEALGQRRRSLSPSRFSSEDFLKFELAEVRAVKEAQVTASVIPMIEGDIGVSNHVAGQIPFTNLEHLTDGSLVSGNPDRYYGARPEQLPRQVRAELSGSIVPSTQEDLPILPNFLLAAKGPDGSSAVASRQACYDGALGARGYHRLQSHTAGKPMFDNKAHVITSTYHAGQLKMYTSHPVQPANPTAQPEYVTTQISCYALTSDTITYRAGAAAYRNGVEWAQRQRDEAIRQSNEKFAATTSVQELVPQAPVS